MSILHSRATNNAIFDNPPFANGREADIHITRQGSDVCIGRA